MQDQKENSRKELIEKLTGLHNQFGFNVRFNSGGDGGDGGDGSDGGDGGDGLGGDSGGAFTIEYTFPFIKRVGVSLGGMIGGGKLTVDLFQNNDDFSWQETWNEFNNPEGTENISRRIENNYITLSPTVNIDIPLTRFFAIRIGSGYQFTMSESWTIENDKTLKSVPSSLNGDAFFIQTGIYLGFFAY